MASLHYWCHCLPPGGQKVESGWQVNQCTFRAQVPELGEGLHSAAKGEEGSVDKFPWQDPEYSLRKEPESWQEDAVS